jgi:hypothetical protein
MSKLQWNMRTSVSDQIPFFVNNDYLVPYIIRLNSNNTYTVYDTRRYGSRQDFNFFGYSVVSVHKSLVQAKRKVSILNKG